MRRAGRGLMVAVSLLALLGLGCASPSTLQVARTVPKGEFVVFGALGAIQSEALSEEELVGGSRWLPAAELGGRVGIRDRVDVGAKAGVGGFTHLDLKVELLRSNWIDLAVAPSIAWNVLRIAADARALFLVDFNLRRQPFEPGAVTLVIGATPVFRSFFNNGVQTWIQASASAGVHWQFDDRITLIAEASRLGTVVPHPLTRHLEDSTFVLGAIQFRPSASEPVRRAGDIR